MANPNVLPYSALLYSNLLIAGSSVINGAGFRFQALRSGGAAFVQFFFVLTLAGGTTLDAKIQHTAGTVSNTYLDVTGATATQQAGAGTTATYAIPTIFMTNIFRPVITPVAAVAGGATVYILSDTPFRLLAA